MVFDLDTNQQTKSQGKQGKLFSIPSWRMPTRALDRLDPPNSPHRKVSASIRDDRQTYAPVRSKLLHLHTAQGTAYCAKMGMTVAAHFSAAYFWALVQGERSAMMAVMGQFIGARVTNVTKVRKNN